MPRHTCQKVRVDKPQAGSEQRVFLDKSKLFVVAHPFNCRQAREKVKEMPSPWHMAKGEFGDDEGMCKQPFLSNEARQYWIGGSQMVNPDRGVSNNHAKGRSRGGALASGIVPPNAIKPFAASRRMRAVRAASISSSRSSIPLRRLALSQSSDFETSEGRDRFAAGAAFFRRRRSKRIRFAARSTLEVSQPASRQPLVWLCPAS